MTRSLTTMLLALASSAAMAGDKTCFDFEMVDVPNPDGGTYYDTSWWGVNNSGVFSGDFCFDEDCTEIGGAIYDSRDGSFEIYTIDGYTTNIDNPRINDRGEIVGVAFDADWNHVSYLRSPDGEITMLDHLEDFAAMDINNKGEIVGFFTNGPIWSYLYEGATVSGRDYTDVEYYEIDDEDWGGWSAIWGSNDHGDVLPTWENTDSWPWYTVGIDTGDGFEAMDIPDPYDGATAWNMNNRGQIVGSLADVDAGTHPGFLLSKDGTMTEVWYGDPADETWTAVLDINDHGVIAGTFDGYAHGFVGTPTSCK